MSSVILVVQLGSGHIHWSRSLTQCALLEWECWWERSPQGHGLGFSGSICSLNIANFLNAAFCSLFSTVSKGRHPKSIPQEFFSVWKYHTQLSLPSFTSPPPHSSSSSPDPSQTLGLGSFPKPVWFSFKEPFRSSCCKPHISKATSSSKPLCCCESRKK